MNIAAGIFKACCLKLLDRVAEQHEDIVVTKRGRPVARIVPVETKPQRPLFGFLRGEVTSCAKDDLFSTGERWDVDA